MHRRLRAIVSHRFLFVQTKSPFTTLEPSPTERSLTQVGIGEHRRSLSCMDIELTMSVIDYSGSPFNTEIGTGKVIQAWDEG